MSTFGTPAGSWPCEINRVVYHATRIPEMSGGSVAIENLADALVQRGIDVEFVSQFPGSKTTPRLTRVVLAHPGWHMGPVLRGATRSLPAAARSVPVLVAKRQELALGRRHLRHLMESYGPGTAVIFTHVKAKQFLDSTGYSPRAEGPLLIGQHHSQFESLDDETWLRDALPAHFSDVDAFTTLTEEDARKFADLIPVPCFGVGNPLPAGWGRDTVSRRKVAVALARFTGEKQLDLMVRAFAAATRRADLEDWSLEIYGSGEQESRIRAAIATTDAAGRIRLMGPTEHPEHVYPQAMLNLNSSSYEGFGLTILEAAACGTPSLAFDCSPGVRGLISPDTGILVQPLTEDSYAHAIREALSDPGRLERMGRAARQQSQRFSPDRIVERWAGILSHALERHSARFSSGTPSSSQHRSTGGIVSGWLNR